MSPGSLSAEGPSEREGDWRLPRGPHKLSQKVVAAHQRQRLLAGAAGALARHGYAQMTVAHVLGEAGISRATFYQHFENKRDCVLVAHEAAFDRLAGELLHACAGESEWTAKLAAGIGAAIHFAVRGPEEAQLLVVDAVAADPMLALRVLASNDYFVGLLRNGREQCPRAAALPELTERALIGATTSTIGTRLLSGQVDQLVEIGPQLVQLVLMPYVGIEEARRVAEATS
ncbi:MAG: TetR/AcrR family transcriptional regulator [Solirubrobacterales bacterium]